MRVLIVPHPSAVNVVGGHSTQQQETVKALRQRGVEAEIASVDDAVRAEASDIVHAFGDARALLERGRPRGRLVVTPIYFPRSFVLGPTPMYRRAERRHMLEVRLRHRARIIRRPRTRFALLRALRAVYEGWRQADLLVVNSRAEAALLRRDVANLPEVRVAYSGVGEAAFGGHAAEGRRLLGIGEEPFVLCVGRIEPRKNQVSLALAVRDLSIPLVLLGTVLPGNEPYLQEVRETLPGVIHVPFIEDHRHVFAAAAAHALPAWYETTGLVTLEALAAGRPVVAARGPCEEEYFGGIAHFCEPDDVSSIGRAVQDALQGPTGGEQEWARRFSWTRTADELLQAYGELLPA